MTITDVLTRLDAILTAAPFGFVAAKEPFGFDLQPKQKVHRTYCLLAGSPRVDGLIGLQQTELTPVRIMVAQLVRRDAVGAYRALLADAQQLQSAIARDGVNGDYNADVTEIRVEEPGPNDDFVIGEIVAVADYERTL